MTCLLLMALAENAIAIPPLTFNTNNYGGVSNTLDLNLNIGQPVSNVPVPAAVWLFGSGFIGLIGLRRKSSKNFAPSV